MDLGDSRGIPVAELIAAVVFRQHLASLAKRCGRLVIAARCLVE